VPTFEVRHIVSFEETNLVGNVYFVNHLRWQGLCREHFIREYLPHLADRFRDGLAFVTVRCSCEYLAEINLFDEIAVRMRLGNLSRSRMSLEFEYFRVSGSGEEVVARGEQEIACMQRNGHTLTPTPFPPEVVDAVDSFAGGGPPQNGGHQSRTSRVCRSG
jgi:enediyne biosynthesis thioesterase